MASVSNCSFKGYIPVQYYAKHPTKDKYVPVIKRENIKKCNGFVVRNLNRTAKNNRNQNFVNQYKNQDRDYRSLPVVKSIYDDETPTVFLVTGKDVDEVNNLAKPVGIAKRESIDAIGNSHSFESKNAAKNYFRNAKNFLFRYCNRVKNEDGKPLTMQVFFNPVYNKRQELKGFDYVKTSFVQDV